MRMPRRSLGMLLLAPAVARAAPLPYAAWLEGWEGVLRQHVDAEGRVDFAGIADAPAPLEALVRWVGAQGPRTRPDLFASAAKVLAYHCNSYNAVAMWRVVEAGIPERFHLLARYQFFMNSAIAVDGGFTTLKLYEDAVIRPLGEERIHFALNCMVRGCPRLPREAFRAEALDTQLAAVTREFCESPQHVRPMGEAAQVSEIFRFYTEDFVPAKAPNLLAYINRHRRTPLPEGLRLGFIPYDWTINRQPPRHGTG
jgi:hypothetical protein